MGLTVVLVVTSVLIFVVEEANAGKCVCGANSAKCYGMLTVKNVRRCAGYFLGKIIDALKATKKACDLMDKMGLRTTIRVCLPPGTTLGAIHERQDLEATTSVTSASESAVVIGFVMSFSFLGFGITVGVLFYITKKRHWPIYVYQTIAAARARSLVLRRRISASLRPQPSASDDNLIVLSHSRIDTPDATSTPSSTSTSTIALPSLHSPNRLPNIPTVTAL